MPVISMFYGVIVLMYYFDNRQHKLPHIHVKYGEEEAVLTIPDGEILEGSLRANKLKLVQAWVEIHREDLMANWDWRSMDNQFLRSNHCDKNMKKVLSAKANDDFTLELTFTDGSVRLFDTKPYHDMGIFIDLKELEYFKDFEIVYGTVQWKNEQDFAPETLYIESVELVEV